ncbi:response regulator [Salinivirga cyanobacteriivorans]
MNKKILIIEDDQILRENTAEILTLSGYDVVTSPDGKDGIRKAVNEHPDLILCDIMMPETDGYSVLHALNQNEQTATIPFIFLTAKTENNALRQGMEMGADDFLYKPFEDIELLNAIQSRLKKQDQLTAITGKEDKTQNDQSTHAEVMQELLSKATPINLKDGETLYHQNEYPHFVYYVAEGSIKTYQLSNQGKTFITGIFHSGSLLGYKPVIEKRPSNQFAEANEPTEIKKIPANSFLDALYNNPQMSKHFIQHISTRLSKKEEELMSVAYNSVRYRIAFKLLELGENHPEGIIDLPRTDLARMIGTTAETLVRTLTEFKNDGLIETNEHHITIPDVKKLRNTLIRF